MTSLSFQIYEKRGDGSTVRRFHKVRYTAALRLGKVLEAVNGCLDIGFQGDVTDAVQAHPGNTAFKGALRIAGKLFPNMVVIVKEKRGGQYDLVTFWPDSQHPDAYKSYTDPLVDTAMDGGPFPIEIVATTMHAAFRENAGVSPATLMNRIYEEQSSELRSAAERIAQELEESREEIRQTEAELVRERAIRQEAEADAAASKAELEQLRQEAARPAPPGTVVHLSNVAVLEHVEEGRRGRCNQRAILLHMSDGTVRANNWAGGYDARLKYARTLVGRRIKTDVWGNYRWQDWFQNIYPANE